MHTVSGDASNLEAGDGHLCPNFSRISGSCASANVTIDGYLIPTQSNQPRRIYLDGNVTRRKLPIAKREYCIWDTHLAGFGLRIRPSGNLSWFVRLRQRGKHMRVFLGAVGDVDAHSARCEARKRLAAAALDGLPQRVARKKSPNLHEYFDEFWTDYARNWKASTQQRNLEAWTREILPAFGTAAIGEITGHDVERWRDSYTGGREAVFNRTVPVFSAIMSYAELLGYRKKGSNPCRRMPRFKRAAKERFLTSGEYRRLGSALRSQEEKRPLNVAIVRLLLLTGARYREIADLHWEWIKPTRLDLPDSKTGPKRILLSSHALEVLNGLSRQEGTPLVFPSRNPEVPLDIGQWWERLRRGCGFPDVRIHDLRHSFASTAIMANVPLNTVGRILGHADPESTARYAHLADDVIADAAARVSGGLAQKLGLGA